MGDFNTGAINNIANIKLGGVQVNNVYLGTTGIWTNKLKFDYTVTQELTFLDPNGEVVDSGQIQGMASTIVKSISPSNDNFSQLATIPYNTTNTFSYYYPSNTLIQSNSYSDIIYKSDLNKFKLINNQFHHWYAGSYTPIDGGQGAETWSGLDDTNAGTIVTNGAYNGSIVLKNQALDIPVDLKINGYKQIDALQINYDLPILTNGALTIRMWIRTDNLTSNTNLGTISSFSFYALNCNLSAYDDAGVFFDFNNNFDIMFNDADTTVTYNNGNGVCEMIWVWHFPPSSMGFFDAWAECGINSVAGSILWLEYNNTTITVDSGYLSNGVYLDSIFLDTYGSYGDGLNWVTLGGDNIMPINTRLKNYKVTLNYNLTDIYG